MVFTRDLRVRDNQALVAAASGGPVIPLFVVDESLGAAAASPNRVTFLRQSLSDLDESVRSAGAGLVLRRGRWVDEVLTMARLGAATSIHVADDVSSFATTRLARLEHEARSMGVVVVRHPGTVVVPPGSISPSSGGEYKVFSPYHRRWLGTPWRPVVARPERLEHVPGVDVGSLDELLPARTGAPGLIHGGEGAALARLDTWASSSLHAYADLHDDLARAATSQLSPYLHFGCLSPLEVAVRLRDRVGGSQFVRQICWRDFFHQILAVRPDAARADYRHRGDRWLDDDESLAAWKDGRTGYPVVDAGMRQLATEGFMHNRARMIVASFLTKDLALDWRHGARHFMEHLVDADVANNQLNWQWVAGTGTDSNPHRIFNPTTQGRRFDPGGAYIRRHVPELAAVSGSMIHDPTLDVRRAHGYVAPLVDHHEAIAAYRARKRTS